MGKETYVPLTRSERERRMRLAINFHRRSIRWLSAILHDPVVKEGRPGYNMTTCIEAAALFQHLAYLSITLTYDDVDKDAAFSGSDGGCTTAGEHELWRRELEESHGCLKSYDMLRFSDN